MIRCGGLRPRNSRSTRDAPASEARRAAPASKRAAVMDVLVLSLFLAAAFAGGFASGLAGFAMGFVVSGVWLHFLTPIQTTLLIVGYGVLTQGYGVWMLRHALAWRTLAPFIIGGAIGVPIG